jgi:hypothetical protein
MKMDRVGISVTEIKAGFLQLKAATEIIKTSIQILKDETYAKEMSKVKELLAERKRSR